jgi:uncharacterized protein (DUF433 family)
VGSPDCWHLARPFDPRSRVTPIEKLKRPYAGSVTVRDAALFLRATTPKPDVPVRLWRPQRHTFAASSYALYAWIRLGMNWQRPVPVSSRDRVITFQDLVRLRMVALMRARGIPFAKITEAEDLARRLTHERQPFITEALWTSSSDIFMNYERQLLAITRGAQLTLELDTLRDYLNPVRHGLTFEDGIARRWEPHAGVTIDPEIQFAAPCISGTRVETEAVWSFREAGESEESLVRLYGLRREQVRAAIEWEQAVSLAA